VRQKRSRYLPDDYSRASSERHPLPCTANPCASPLHQQVTEVSKSQWVKSCSAYNIASGALGETPLHARMHLIKPAPVCSFDRAPPRTRRGAACGWPAAFPIRRRCCPHQKNPGFDVGRRSNRGRKMLHRCSILIIIDRARLHPTSADFVIIPR
jgi:hypothetical protein